MRVLILMLATTALLAATSCRFVTGKRVKGEGNVKEESRPETGFEGVESHGSFDIYVSSGDNVSVRVEAEENLLPYIETYVDRGILQVETRDGYNLDPGRQIRIYVTAPNFRRIHSSGSGDIIGENKITGTGKLDLGISGSADIKMEVDAPEIDADITGAGNINLVGQTRIFNTRVSGSGDIRAMDLKSEETNVRITGSGNAAVFASVKLDVSVAGSGDVRYKGNAQVTSNIAGSGNVKKVE